MRQLICPRATRHCRGCRWPVTPLNASKHISGAQYIKVIVTLPMGRQQWRRQDFVTGGGMKYGSIGGLEYEVSQSRLYCLCINVALCSTALQCICRVIRRSSVTMKAHTYYIIFGRPPIGGGASPLPPPGGASGRQHMKRTTDVISERLFFTVTQNFINYAARRSFYATLGTTVS